MKFKKKIKCQPTTNEYKINQMSPTNVQLIKNDMEQLDYETTPTIVSEIILQV